MKKELSGPIIAVIVAVVVIVAGVFLYRAATGGVQGDGVPRISARMPNDPPGPKVAPPRMPPGGFAK